MTAEPNPATDEATPVTASASLSPQLRLIGYLRGACLITDQLLEHALTLPVSPDQAARIAVASKELHLVALRLLGGAKP